MFRARTAAVALAAAALCTAWTVPAHAASAPQVRSTSSSTTFEFELASIEVRYRCAPGAWVSLGAELRQGGTFDEPTSLYAGPTGSFRPTCDGEKHTALLELRIADWDWDAGSANYEFLTPTAAGGQRAHVTVTMFDHLGGVIDVDHDRVKVLEE